MQENIFRKKSMDKISSPESLNDYIKVANPSAWLVMLAIMFILIGALAWAANGELVSDMDVVVYSDENGDSACYISEKDIGLVGTCSQITINGNVYELGAIPKMPVRLAGEKDYYLIHILGGSDGDTMWMYKIDVKEKLPNGVYTGELELETVKPMTLLFN